MRILRWTLVGVAIVCASAFATAQQGAPGGEWTRYGGDSGTTKYAPLDQINKDNISCWSRLSEETRSGGFVAMSLP